MVADQLAPIGTSTWDTRCLVTCETLNVTNMIASRYAAPYPSEPRVLDSNGL